MNVEEAFVAYVRGSTLTNHVSDRIYKQHSNQEDIGLRLVYQTITGERIIHMTGRAGLNEAVLEVTAWREATLSKAGMSSVMDLSDEFVDLFDGVTAATVTSGTESFEWNSSRVENVEDIQEVRPGQQFLQYGRRHDLHVWYKE